MRPLTDLRRRVERLAGALAPDCAKPHVLVKHSSGWEDAPVPAWPAADAPTQCACGREIRYRHVVAHFRWEGGTPGPDVTEWARTAAKRGTGASGA